MQPLFRYIDSKYLHSFVREGSIRMRSLSYYRDYEDSGVRADPFEGTLTHLPQHGLKAELGDTGEVRSLPYTFESTAREDDIFVYCVSAELSKNLAEKFETDTCVEIHKPIQFLHRLRATLGLRSRIRANALVHGHVRYYEVHEPPIIDWARPERIAMRKRSELLWLNEYRFAVPLGDAFAVENVSVKLVPLGAQRPSRSTAHPELTLKLGELSKICKVHRL